MPPSCVFDEIIEGRLPAAVVVAAPDVVAFLDNRPVFPGHALVVPRRHIATLAELSDELADRVFTVGRQLAAAMRPALGADGAFLGLNDEVSQSVAHVHLHVIPRRRRDGLRGFFWPRQRYADEEQPGQLAAALRSALAAADPS